MLKAASRFKTIIGYMKKDFLKKKKKGQGANWQKKKNEPASDRASLQGKLESGQDCHNQQMNLFQKNERTAGTTVILFYFTSYAVHVGCLIFADKETIFPFTRFASFPVSGIGW